MKRRRELARGRIADRLLSSSEVFSIPSHSQGPFIHLELSPKFHTQLRGYLCEIYMYTLQEPQL